MRCLVILSRLLDYPTAELYAHGADLRALVAADPSLGDASRRALQRFLDQRLSQDLLDWQSEYDALFDRGRSVSLHLFEHVHGESRDRGQAMVDLLANYRQAGLELGLRELPDYLPLYLEFAATQDAEAIAWLQDIAPVLALLTARLQERDTDYALLTEVLLDLSGVSVALSQLRDEVAREDRDDTPEALDRLWEDEAVSFAAADATSPRSSCPTERHHPSAAQRRDDVLPVRIIDPSPAPVGHP